mgnify:CR=1 FL=1
MIIIYLAVIIGFILVGNTIFLDDSLSEYNMLYKRKYDQFFKNKEEIRFEFGADIFTLNFNIDCKTAEEIYSLSEIFKHIDFALKFRIATTEIIKTLPLNFSLFFLNKHLSNEE